MGADAKPIIELMLARTTARMRADRVRKRALRRAARRGARDVLQRLSPAAIMIVEDRQAFEMDGDFMQVERRLPAGNGDPLGDVILLRSCDQLRERQQPYVRAIQVYTLERLIDEERISLCIVAGQAPFPFSSTRTIPAPTTNDSHVSEIAA